MTTPWEGITPRKWQAECLPLIIAAARAGKRSLVSAVMGSGKSYLQAEVVRMALPNLRGRVAVVTAPTERLVRQLSATIASRVGADHVGVYYGKKKQQDRRVIVCCNPSLPSLHKAMGDRKTALALVDEAHRSEAARVRDTLPRMQPAAMTLFTATPFRSIPSECISLADELVYRYDLFDAVRDGVLVEPKVIGAPEQYHGDDIDDVCLWMMREHARGPGIVSATGIPDAEQYAARLTSQGFGAMAIHSKLSTSEQDARIALLKSGELRCLVHVSLLAEGVDLPWLRWLCLRRNVQARVRFLQEVGRVLRVDREDPTKTEGVIIDPHLTLGRHGWTTAASIGKALEEAAEHEAREGGAACIYEPTGELAVALDALLSYLESARKDLEAAGICGEAMDGGERLAPVTEKQVQAIKNASKTTRHIPKRRRDPFRALVKVPWALNRGQASDLLSVLFGGSRWARAEAARIGSREPWRLQWKTGLVPSSLAIPDAPTCQAVLRWGQRVARIEKKQAERGSE